MPLLAVGAVAAVVAAGLAGVLRDADVPRATVRPGLVLGINADFEGITDAQRRAQARRVARVGVGSVREDLSWRDVEPRRGRRDWRRADSFIASAVRAGLRPLPILDTTPGWAGPDPEGMPRDPRTYAAFVAAAVARYGPGGSFWRRRPDLDARLAPRWFELYNEPWFQEGIAPAEYARTVAAATPAGRRANSQARFLVAVEVASRAGEPWLEGLYAADPDFGSHFDGVALHPYGDGSALFEAPGEPPLDRFDPNRIDLLRAELVRRGAGRKPVWVTEIGWATCPSDGRCVSTDDQARNLARFITLASTRWAPWMQAVYAFQIGDYRTARSDPEGWFGLERRDGSAKPSRTVLRTAALAERRAAAGR